MILNVHELFLWGKGKHSLILIITLLVAKNISEIIIMIDIVIAQTSSFTVFYEACLQCQREQKVCYWLMSFKTNSRSVRKWFFVCELWLQETNFGDEVDPI